jgi:Fe-S cluster assembly protein SufD
LRSRRSAAADKFANSELPTPDEEIWRYSRIDEFDLADFAPVGPGPLAETDGRPPAFESLDGEVGQAAAIVVLRNGRVVHRQVRDDVAAKGVRVDVAGDGDESLVGRLFEPATAGDDSDDAPDVFVTLNDAFVAEPVVVDIPAGVDVDGPVVVAHWTEGDGVATFPRIVVHAAGNSDVSIVEIQGSDEGASLVVPVTEIIVDRDARVGYVTLQRLGLRTWQLGRQVSSLDANATLRSSGVGFGGEFARLRTDCRMVGRGATGNLDAIFFGEGDQTLDFRTFQNHIAPDCTSNLLFKGAVGGHSKSVYTGLIRVGKEGRGTNAFQTNRNIKLSDHAWAESVPNLVIENNDVRCSHASAVGPIDEEQRFYLESRGVPTDVAERLIVSGFFGEVLANLPVPALVAPLQRTITEKFERRED